MAVKKEKGYARRNLAVHGTLLKRSPSCPKRYTDDRVRKEWQRICNDLNERGRLYDVTVQFVEMYVDAYLDYLTAQDAIMEDGRLVPARDSVKRNPMLFVKSEAFKTMMELDKRLGLTPHSRDRVEPNDASNREQNSDPLSDYLN